MIKNEIITKPQNNREVKKGRTKNGQICRDSLLKERYYVRVVHGSLI